MREHPIPQDVVGYRFHIIGNMTLKQFAEVGAGCIIGFLIYTTNLPAFIKWPFISIAVALGALAAFVPFEERPFDHWIVTFFRVLYKPTKFFWKREPHIPDAFLYTPNPNQVYSEQEMDMTPLRRQRIKEYLFSIQGGKVLDSFDSAEQVHIDSIMSAFNSTHVTPSNIEKVAHKPSLKVRPHQLKGGSLEPHVPIFTVDQVVSPYQEIKVHANTIGHTPLPTEMVAQDIEIPVETAVEVEATAPEIMQQVTEEAVDDRAYMELQQTAGVAATEDVTLNNDLPFPEPPDIPNKLVGMVLSPENDLINDAIVEIQANDGRVARAVKTNALGQFYITTPLENGDYTILIEKEGYSFNPQQISLNGELVAPIELRSVT